jgi:hypothetical protein
LEGLIKGYGLVDDRYERMAGATKPLVAGVHDEDACHKWESKCVNPSLGYTLEWVAPLAWGRNVLGFCRASLHIRDVYWAETQIAAEKLTRDTDQER